MWERLHGNLEFSLGFPFYDSIIKINFNREYYEWSTNTNTFLIENRGQELQWIFVVFSVGIIILLD